MVEAGQSSGTTDQRGRGQAGSTAVRLLVSPWLRGSARDLLLSNGAVAPTDPRAWIGPNLMRKWTRTRKVSSSSAQGLHDFAPVRILLFPAGSTSLSTRENTRPNSWSSPPRNALAPSAPITANRRENRSRGNGSARDLVLHGQKPSHRAQARADLPEHGASGRALQFVEGVGASHGVEHSRP